MPEQPENAPDEVDHKIAQARRRVSPLHIRTEGISVGAAECLPAQIGRITEDAVETTARNDLRKFEKPVEEALAKRDVPGHRRRLALGPKRAGPVAAEFTISDQLAVIFLRLGNVELSDRNRGDLVERPSKAASPPSSPPIRSRTATSARMDLNRCWPRVARLTWPSGASNGQDEPISSCRSWQSTRGNGTGFACSTDEKFHRLAHTLKTALILTTRFPFARTRERYSRAQSSSEMDSY